MKLVTNTVLFLVCMLAPIAAAVTVVSVNPTVRHQTFEGFGEGTMDQFTEHYYNNFSSALRSDYLDKLYTLDSNGLGLTICRVPMPVGDAPGHTHHSRYSDGRPPEAFEPEEGVFEWNSYNDLLWKAQGAEERGAKMWAYWFSMPYWLTVSGCTAGNGDGTTNNLRAGKESRFAEHMCSVLRHFREAWDIEFDYVSAINEPECDWWDYGGGQPGCHVSSDQAVLIYAALKEQLALYSLAPLLVAYDSAYTNTVTYLNSLLGSSVENDLSVLTCHQYSTSDWGLREWAYIRSRYQKSLWMSEWGDWTNAQYPGYTPGGDAHQQMMNYADKIHEALSTLKANGWVMWEPEFIFDTQAGNFQPRKAYWAVAQYSRHVRPGMVMIQAQSDNPDLKTTAWLGTSTTAGRDIVLVTVNNGASPISVNFDLSEFAGIDIEEVRTTSSDQSYSQVSFEGLSAGRFHLDVPAKSITTVSAKVRHCDRLQSDVSENCIVDFEGLEELAETWLLEHHPAVDISGDGTVNGDDIAVMSREWKDYHAFAPFPYDGAENIKPTLLLMKWGVNAHAKTSDVYLGTDRSAVCLAGRSDAEFMGSTANSCYCPVLSQRQTYYWRVDAVNESGAVCKGSTWSFATGDERPDADLLAYWKLDEDSGSMAADSSVYGHHGWLRGNPGWRPDGGRMGGAIELDGQGDAIEIEDFSITTDQLTMTAWINCRELVPWAGIVYSRNGAACGIHFENVSRLRYTWNNNDPLTWNWDTGLLIPNQEWTFVGLVIRPDCTELYAYADSTGFQEVIHSLPNKLQTLNNLKIGWDSQADDRYFKGLIDHVKVYGRALCKEEIVALIQ